MNHYIITSPFGYIVPGQLQVFEGRTLCFPSHFARNLPIPQLQPPRQVLFFYSRAEFIRQASPGS